jgi:glycerol-3-phosphate O-acyltransferase / dihydroxyacetone phosphate acyltransferase
VSGEVRGNVGHAAGTPAGAGRDLESMTIARATVPASDRADALYAAVRLVARFWLWFLFRSVDVRHPERVPAIGPVLLCINHPNNFIDSLVVGAAIPRKVHYLATAALFRHSLIGRFLRACGAIPVYRRQDDPDRMDRNVEMFEACFAALREGHLVGIYPEGTTHAEARVQRIKTGAARIALGYEAQRPGELVVVPVGLTFETRKSFKGRVLVSFGPPITAGAYLAAYREDPVKAVDSLTDTIQWGMEAEVVHVARIDESRLVQAVEDLYGDVLAREVMEHRGLARRDVDRRRLARSIVDAVEHFKARDPERVERLWQRIQAYRALLAEFHVRDDAVRARLARHSARVRLRHSGEALLGLPVFAYGAVVNALPYFIPRWLARRTARKETDYATTRFLASVVAFPLFWGFEIWLVARLAGGRWALVFAASLPVSGLLAYRYLVGADRLRQGLRLSLLSLRASQVASRLTSERAAILAELDRARHDYLTATRGSSF